jgi:hypothetical protein
MFSADDRGEYAEYVKLHNDSFKKYTCKKGYDYSFFTYKPQSTNVYWWRLYIINDLLNSTNYDYIVYADTDTMIQNYDIRLEDIINTYGDKDIFIGHDRNHFTFFLPYVYCSGVFIIKNSTIGRNFVSECIKRHESEKLDCVTDNGKLKGIWAGRCYEQGVMNTFAKSCPFKDNVANVHPCIFENNADNIRKSTTKSFVLHQTGRSDTTLNTEFREITKTSQH